MDPLKLAAAIATGLLLSGCAESLDGYSAYSGADPYTTPGYYGAPAYSAPGYYAQPGYAAPYPYQPGYVAPFAYDQGWGSGRGNWREHEWRERREHAFDREGPRQLEQRQFSPQVPPMAARPPNLAPPPPAPRMASPPQAQQNTRLLDQLGFRPSR